MPVVIDVDPGVFDAASAIVGQDMAGAIENAWLALTRALQECAAMAGDDPGGRAWAREYDPAAQAVVATVTDLRNSCMKIASMLEVTGFNHGLAEAASDPARAVPTPADTTRYEVPFGSGTSCVPGHTVPFAAGGTGHAPHGWGLVEHAIGYVWPNGHPDRLRTAARAWAAASAALDSVTGYLPELLQSLTSQSSPEIDDACAVCESLATHLHDTAACCQHLAAACRGLAGHIEHAHHEIEHELISFLEWSAGIEAAGLIGSLFTLGAAEAAAQAAESARIATTGARIAEIIRALAAAAHSVAATITGVVDRIGEIAAKLRVILGAQLTRVTTTIAERLPEFAGDTGSIAFGRFASRSTRVARRLARIHDPRAFDPHSLKGLTMNEVRDGIPPEWTVSTARNGGGTVYRDPAHRGRQIRIMPGYPPGTRANPITTGPYVVVSQNGETFKVALFGNPTLP